MREAFDLFPHERVGGPPGGYEVSRDKRRGCLTFAKYVKNA